MNVFDLLEKRALYGLDIKNEDKWLSDAVKSNEEKIVLILTENVLNQIRRNPCLLVLFEHYKLSALFDLKNPYVNTNVSLFLYVFEKNYAGEIKYGIYKETIKNRARRGELLELNDEYPEQYFEYLDSVERFIDTNTCPEDGEIYEFGYISDNLVEKKIWNPNRYSKQALKIRKSLEKEETIVLSDVAEIIRPRPDRDKNHTSYIASPGTWQYPVNYENFREGVLTDTPLKKGDIVLLMDRMFFVYDELEQEVHTSPNATIIRPHGISAVYLYLYLSSETSKIIMNSMAVGNVLRQVRRTDLEKFIVVIPNKSEEHYNSIFISENFLLKDVSQYNNLIQSISDKEENIEDILNVELVSNLKMCKTEIMSRFLEEDLNELNTCFRHQAYKATLILAGSILEAVLIDWLSEIHKVNYFEEDYYVTDRNGRRKRADLIDYINEIKEIKQPNWVDEADKAHKIRQKRNLVHAKLCMNSDEISEEVCKEVIEYLEEVLQTRNRKVKKYK